MLTIGLLLCLGIGLLIGWQMNFIAETMPGMFSPTLKPEFLFYPPIVTLFVDMMHSIASRFEHAPDLDKVNLRD